jgi:hypothetical protein
MRCRPGHLTALFPAGLALLHIHDLRHAAVALWIAAGAKPKQIAIRAGHTSTSVVLDRCGHPFRNRTRHSLTHWNTPSFNTESTESTMLAVSQTSGRRIVAA